MQEIQSLINEAGPGGSVPVYKLQAVIDQFITQDELQENLSLLVGKSKYPLSKKKMPDLAEMLENSDIPEEEYQELLAGKVDMVKHFVSENLHRIDPEVGSYLPSNEGTGASVSYAKTRGFKISTATMTELGENCGFTEGKPVTYFKKAPEITGRVGTHLGKGEIKGRVGVFRYLVLFDGQEVPIPINQTDLITFP